METIETDVLIAGAGPTGMTLALTLCRAGANVLIADKAPTTRPHSQAAVLWPRSLEVLDLLGIAEDWRGISVPLHGFRVTIDGQPASLELTPRHSPFPQPWCVGQDRSEAVLDQRLRETGADVRRGHEVTNVQIGENGATATLRDAEGGTQTVQAAWIVGCEGAHSVVRDAAGITRQGALNAGVMIIQGDVRVGGPLTLEPGRGYIWSEGGHSALFVLPVHVDGHYRVFAALPDDGGKEPPTLDDLQRLARPFVPGITLFDPDWLNRYRTQHQIADTYRRGRAFVAGDAAHVWVPVGGQGMNIAMQDAFDLGWKLGGVISGQLPETVLDTYDTERRPVGEANIAVTEQAYRALLHPEKPVDAALRKILPRALGLAPLTEKIAERFAELDTHYPPSALIVDNGGSSGPAPGVRAPDAYVNRDGQTIRLFDLYRPGRWVVFGWAVHRGDYAAQDALQELPFGDVFLVDSTHDGAGGWTGATLRDFPRFAAEAYGVDRPAIHVIRPDGVIGYRGPADRRLLDRYFSGMR